MTPKLLSNWIAMIKKRDVLTNDDGIDDKLHQRRMMGRVGTLKRMTERREDKIEGIKNDISLLEKEILSIRKKIKNEYSKVNLVKEEIKVIESEINDYRRVFEKLLNDNRFENKPTVSIRHKVQRHKNSDKVKRKFFECRIVPRTYKGRKAKPIYRYLGEEHTLITKYNQQFKKLGASTSEHKIHLIKNWELAEIEKQIVDILFDK